MHEEAVLKLWFAGPKEYATDLQKVREGLSVKVFVFTLYKNFY